MTLDFNPNWHYVRKGRIENAKLALNVEVDKFALHRPKKTMVLANTYKAEGNVHKLDKDVRLEAS